jgi:hypothetical protein
MEEVKVTNNEVKTSTQPSLIEKVDKLYYDKYHNQKSKNLKLLRKAKVRGRKAKKGWMGVLKVDENGNITGEKTKIDDSVFVTRDGKYHATKHGEEVLMWNGKFPVLIQQSWLETPINLRKTAEHKDETYGQKYIMARMLNDTIKIKNKGGGFLLWIIIGAVVIFGINYFMKGG